MGEWGPGRLQDPSIQSMHATFASARVTKEVRWYISFFRLAHRLSATALSLAALGAARRRPGIVGRSPLSEPGTGTPTIPVRAGDGVPRGIGPCRS